jgi:hypothetical protein
MRARLAALALLATSCATSRHVATIVNDTAAVTGIVHAAVARYVPDPAPNPTLTPRQQAVVNAIPAVIMMGVAAWNLIEQWHAASPDLGAPADMGAP